MNSQTAEVSIARMNSPGGWLEPGQTPEFDEYSVVLRGMLRAETKTATIEARPGQAIMIARPVGAVQHSRGRGGGVHCRVPARVLAGDSASRRGRSMTGSRPTDGMEEFNRRVDFGCTSADYVRYRAGFPQEFFDCLRRFDVGLPGQRLLDLGSGTGTIARGMAAAGCRVTVLDPALPQLQEARRLAEGARLHLDPLVAKSEALPLANDSFDVVTAGQCWHWFDRQRAAAGVCRLLVGGRRRRSCISIGCHCRATSSRRPSGSSKNTTRPGILAIIHRSTAVAAGADRGGLHGLGNVFL